MTQHRRALAGALLSVPLALSLVACGGGTGSGGSTSSDVTGSPAVGVDEGGTAGASPSGTVDPSIAAVIGSWAAQYGVARNQVQTALTDLGSAAQGGGAAGVKQAAVAVSTAVRSAEALPPSPDTATETAYRAALTTLSGETEKVVSSGDAAAATSMARRAGTVFADTESALTAAYG